MNDDWLIIDDYPLPEFNQATWYKSGESVLVWDRWAQIASYGYTQKGKGRWRSNMGVINPTHWMPLPGPPRTTSPQTGSEP